jgi:hypothetical protein
MQPIRSPDGQNSFELMLSYGYYPAVIVISDEDDKLFSHTSEKFSEEKLKAMNLSYDDICMLCLEDMQSTLDGDAIVHASMTQYRNSEQVCSHKYHANCFLELCQNTYIRQDVTITFPHILMPAKKCVLCKRFEEWKIVETGMIMPDRVRVYGFHKYQDTWSPTNKIICQNWITCPVLYSALQENLSVRIVGNDPLPVEYSMEGRNTPARLKEVAEDYFEHALPKRACSICRKKKRMHKLFGHRPFVLQDHSVIKCTYRLCEDCFKEELPKAPILEDQRVGRMFCPRCDQFSFFLYLTGNRE